MPRSAPPPLSEALPRRIPADVWARFAPHLSATPKAADLSQEQIAAHVGVAQQTVSAWLSGRQVPSRSNTVRLVELLDPDPELVERYLLWPLRRDDASTVAPDAVVHVARNGYAAAGHGVLNVEADDETDPYPRRELSRITNLHGPSLERIRSITVIGDSLAPEILPNSRVLYVPSEQYLGDGLYVLSIDGAELVKLLQQLPGGAIRLKPINPIYDQTELHPLRDADTPNTFRETASGLVSQLRFVGKVVGYLKPA